MTIQRIDPMQLDSVTATRLAEIGNAAKRDAGESEPLLTGPVVKAQAELTSSNRPYDAMWIAREPGGVIVGYASYEFSVWDNPHLAFVSLAVDPATDLERAGAALVQAQVAEARSTGRTTVMGFVRRESPIEKLMCANGFEVVQHSAMRRLRLEQVNYHHLAELAQSAARSALDYELIPLDGPTPDAWVEDLCVLFEAINDAPLDGIDAEPAVFPAERVRAYDTAMAARGQHVYRLVARHRAGGAWAGHTILCVDTLRPGLAFQEDTSVLGAHRGHRLGLLLKARMLLWMREVHPELTLVDTWNAENNTHMIAVNDQLGCQVASLGSAVQLLT